MGKTKASSQAKRVMDGRGGGGGEEGRRRREEEEGGGSIGNKPLPGDAAIWPRMTTHVACCPTCTLNNISS